MTDKPAIIAENKMALIPVRAPFLNVIINAIINMIKNQKPNTIFKKDTNNSKIGINDKKDKALLMISGGTEYPIALTTWFKDSGSPLSAIPI